MNLRDTKNLLLQQLPPDEMDRLAGDFVEEAFVFKQPLVEQGKPVDSVYFVESGVVSVVTDLEEGTTIETGTIGNEGLVGVTAVLGGARSPVRAVVQIPGSCWRVPARTIGAERDRSSQWFHVLLRYVDFVTGMVAQTAACNRIHTVDARMSRWLLMTHDRVDADEFPLTQEFLGRMLGAARPTVNIAGAMLQRAGFITYMRGRIAIVDRKGLESASCECYQRIRDELVETINGQRPPAEDERRGAQGRKK